MFKKTLFVLLSLFLAVTYLPFGSDLAWASGIGDDDYETGEIPPYILKGKVTGPTRFATPWIEKELDAPLYAQVTITWDASFIRQNSILSQLYTGACEFRRGLTVVASGGYTGSYSFKADKTTHSQRGQDYELYCKLRYQNPDKPGEVLFGKISDPNTSEFTLFVSHCEANFNTITRRLGVAGGGDDPYATPVGMASITDDSFRGWAGSDGFDACGFDGFECTKTLGTGERYKSGDKEDIKAAMAGAQCSSPTMASLQTMIYQGNFGGSVLDSVKSVTDARQPATLSLLSLTALNNNQVSGHVVIGLNVTKSTSAGLQYSVEALDSNGPKIVTMSCAMMSTIVQGNQVQGVLCNHPDLGLSVPMGGVGVPSGLRTLFQQRCGSSPTTAFCAERQNMTAWLRSNYPQVTNFTTGDHPAGICRGWSNFVLAVAYLGDFVGECPRP